MPKSTNDLDKNNITKKENKVVKNIEKKDKKSTNKKTISDKNSLNSKTTSKTTKKKTTTKSATVSKSKSAAKKETNSTSKSKVKKNTKKVETVTSLEYYDLPYRYNQTIVKILAQTPNTLFIYWDISDDDRKNLENIYGNDFFYNTKPVLIIHNETKNYSFEIDINDFANSWYLNISDTNCKYNIELGRRFINNPIKEANSTIKNKPYNNYIYISSSNELITPNDHVLLSNLSSNTVKFKNIKSNTYYSKEIKNIPFIKFINFYKEFYSREILDNLPFNKFSNPSSSFNIKTKENNIYE